MQYHEIVEKMIFGIHQVTGDILTIEANGDENYKIDFSPYLTAIFLYGCRLAKLAQVDNETIIEMVSLFSECAKKEINP